MNRLKATFALFFCSLALPAQQTNLLLVGQGAPVSAGTTVTVHLGGTAISNGLDDGGNALSPYADPIETPSSMTNPSWGSVHVWLDDPDSTTPNSGGALYSSSSGPNTLICSAFSSATPTTGWNTYTPTGCGTPATSTAYYPTAIQASNVVTEGRNDGNGSTVTCPTSPDGEIFANDLLGSFTSNASWPGTFPANDYPGGHGCYGVYIDLTYTTTSPLTVVTAGACSGYADNASPEICNDPPSQTGNTLIGFTARYQEVGGDTVTMKDSAGNTMTNPGTCSASSNGSETGNDLWTPCGFYESNVASGLTSVQANFSGTSAHDVLAAVEITGTASSSFDSLAQDTTGSGPTFSGKNLVTTHANVEAVCIAVSSDLVVTGSPGTFAATGGWTLVTTGTSTGSGGGSAFTFAIFEQLFSSAGTYNCTGTYSGSGASVYTYTMGFHN